MITIDVIDILVNLKENENILKIIDIFYWKKYKNWIKYQIMIKMKYIDNDLSKIIIIK